MDFIFGTLATDELRLLHQHIAKLGLQHAHEIEPRSPRPNEPVTLTVIAGQDIPAQHVACYFTVDGSEPSGSRSVAQNGSVILLNRTDLQWDTASYGFTAMWQGELPGQPAGTIVRYRIGAWAADEPETFADYPELKATTERAAAAFFRGEPATDLPPLGSAAGVEFRYHVNTYQPPQWARDAVIYQVFVDRFYPGNGKDWNQASSLSDFYGGTMWGVRDKMDYIAELGVNCIWLSPIFPSPTHHGYDATDYCHVEARLGGDDALRAVVEAAHQREIKIVLDFVVNHVSHDLPIFQNALQDENSLYREWFTFDNSEIGYKTFFGVPTMPVISLQNPEARAWMLDNAQFWLREFDIDGYRLDHANGAGPDFWVDFRRVCRDVKPDCFCFGEVVEAPNIMRTYAGRLDGLLDFYAADAIRKRFGWQTLSKAQYDRFLDLHYAYYPDDFIMLTFLDNHDMDRFLYIAGGDQDALRQAAQAQMRLPEPPVIYYGTEVGLSQKKSSTDGLGLEESRLPMLWGDSQDKDLLRFYRRIIAQRRG